MSSMGVSSLLNELRHFSSSRRLCSLMASKTHSIVVSDSDQFHSPKPNPNLLTPTNPRSRWFSASRRDCPVTEGLGSKKTSISDIVDAIRSDDTDLESELDRMVVSLSVDSATRIFHALNSKKFSALRFSSWIRASMPRLSRNPEICSLVVDNLGRLSDYESMTLVLNEFRAEKFCLTQSAFRYLAILSTKNEVIKVVKILNEVGGSCRSSGVRSLVEMFGGLGRFEEAKLVIRLSENVSASYYNILIREKCRRNDPKGAEALLEEMRLAGCEPGIASHNLVLSALCKTGASVRALAERFKVLDCSPDEMTFEMLVLQALRQGEFDLARGFEDEMAMFGLEPRMSTHSAFVKAYFEANLYKEAYEYVGVWSSKHRQSSNVLYSLLAELHMQKGDFDAALSVVFEMIEKGLRPRSLLYKSLLERLRKSGRNDLAVDLESRCSNLS